MILSLVFLILGQFSASSRDTRSFIELSHYLRVSISSLLRSLITKKKKKNCSLLQTLGGVTAVRPGPGRHFQGRRHCRRDPTHCARPPPSSRLRAPHHGPGSDAGVRTGPSSVLNFSFRRQPQDCSLPLPPPSFPTLRRSLTPPGLLTLDRLRGFIRPSGGVPWRRAPSRSGAAGVPFKCFSKPLLPFPSPTLLENREEIHPNAHDRREVQGLRGHGRFPGLPLHLESSGESVSPPLNYSDNYLEPPLGAVFRQLEMDGLNFLSLPAAPGLNPVLSTAPALEHLCKYTSPTIIFCPINHLANITSH